MLNNLKIYLVLFTTVFYCYCNTLLYYGRMEICSVCHWYHYLGLLGDIMAIWVTFYPYYHAIFISFAMMTCNGIYCYHQTKILIDYFVGRSKCRKWRYCELVNMHRLHGQICRYYMIVYDEF